MSRRVYGLQRQPSGKCRFAGHGHTGFGGVILPGNGLWRCSFALLLQSQWRINFTSGSRSLLPLGPRYYPEDQVTDVDLRYMSAEIIREKALYLLQDEIPHSLAVEVDEFVERSATLTYISAVLYVERESQKPIVLGSGGAMIKRIGQAARPEIEELVGTKVYLELWVKVWERWRRRQNLLKQLGYAVEAR